MTDRVIVYSGAIPLETDVLRTNKFAMMAVAKLAAAMLGTSTVVNGLACVPTGPAGLTVNVNPGEIYSLVNVDSTAYSSVAADTTHSILKQGVLLDTLNLACNPPGTGGQSINYLIQATYQDSDTDNVALPYYNASNPTQAWSGPNNTGTAQSTTRKGVITINAKAGTAATTGSQTTPAADSGYTGLWVVTVANGQTQILAGNIVQATNAPILPADLLHAVQASSLITGTDTGAANACVVNYGYPVTALTDGMVLWFKAKAANTGATTLNVNGLGAQPVVGGNQSALQGGELVANGKAQVVWNATISSFVLLECTGAALQVAPATQSQHALQLGQATGRLLNIQTFTVSGTYTPTAGTKNCRVTVVGGGSSGGGAAVTTSGQWAAGGGGGGGANAIGYYPVATLTGQTVTVGAGGAAASGNGNNGGTSSIGAVVTAGGGVGGAAGFAATTPVVAAGGSGGASIVGANVSGGLGGPGGGGIAMNTGNIFSGSGGGSYLSQGSVGILSSNSAGNAGSGPGCGGSGATSSNGGVARASGAGSAGSVIIEEFA